MPIIKKYNTLIQSHSLHDFLDKLLHNLQSDFIDYKLKSGFISFLEETKVNERFSIISAFGRFINENGVYNIGASEIDILSIVYLKKDGIFINKKYVDIITKDEQDVFLYIELENELNQEEQEKFKNLINYIKNTIIEKNWNTEVQAIVNKVKSLKTLDKTVLDILEFSSKKDKTSLELINLIKGDLAIVSSLLKVANSAIFGFRNKVETLDSLVSLLGINFTISLILANGVENSLKMDFSVYGHDENSFRDITHSRLSLLNIWLSKVDNELKYKLMIPIILYDIGKYIISNELISLNLKEDFQNESKSTNIDISVLEEKYCSISSFDVSTLLLKYWKIDDVIINNIKNNKKIEIINTICNTREQFTEESIVNGINKAKQYGFNIDILEESIKKFKNNLDV